IILRQAARLARWKVTIVPPGGKCIQCRLCLPHCPFDAINSPAAGLKKDSYTLETRKIAVYLLITIFMVVLGAYTGYALGEHLAQGDLAVLRAAIINDQPTPGISQADRLTIAASIRAAGLEAQEINATAEALIRRFELAFAFILAGLALVISVKLVKTTIYRTSDDYLPDSGNCFSCGRCFDSCPNECVPGQS
ncbi:MAG: 4Fe-4S binding protein, partial [Sedimentisphaerales bacterium]|nr:4Fe-4S binding protein [Sedimentisphaerales bacterium]